MTRRAALLAVLSTPLAGYRRAEATTPALLTINLDQWREIVVTYGDRAVIVSAADVFKILQEEQ